MKILKLHFNNLNSLTGAWSIDLENPAYVSDGIFAITGPTGAGKSTILDAICLALYGQTPRLGKITAGANEIMSRHTGECFAEITFETAAGRFLCRWAQHRAHKKHDRALQTPRHEISCFDTGKIFESTITGVEEHVKKVTGMDFDQFTRSILLAQGRFAAFLQASSDDRSPLLEQITGTEIYTEISRHVHERNRSEQQKLKQLQSESEGIVILTEEEELKGQQELRKKEDDDKALTGHIDKTKQAIAWLTAIAGLEKQVQETEKENIRLQADLNQFAPARERLALAKKAATLDGKYALLSATRKEQQADTAALAENREALPRLENTAVEQKKRLDSAELDLTQARKNLSDGIPLIQDMRLRDQSIASQKKIIDENLVKIKNVTAQLATEKRTLQKKRDALKEADIARAGIEQYLTEHARDEWLVSGLTGVVEQLGHFVARQKDSQQKEADLKKAQSAFILSEKKLAQALKNHSDMQKKLGVATEKLKQNQDALEQLLSGRSLREYRDRAEDLQNELVRLAKIATLDVQRATLVEGEPCPLCGSVEHPYLTGSVPQDDGVRTELEKINNLIRQAESQETLIKELHNSQTLALQKMPLAETNRSTASLEKTTAETAVATNQALFDRLRAEIAEQKQAILARLSPLGIAGSGFPDDNVSLLQQSLQDRLENWVEHTKKKTRIESWANALKVDVERRSAAIAIQEKSLDSGKEQIEVLEEKYRADSEKRMELYGDKNPDDETARLNAAVSSAEKVQDDAKIQHDRQQQALTSARTLVQSIEERVNQRVPRLDSSETAFASELNSAGFADEEHFVRAKASPDELNRLLAEEKELNDRQTAIRATKTDRESRLSAEREKNITTEPLSELQIRLHEQEAELARLKESIITLKQVFIKNNESREKFAEKLREIEVQSIIQDRWSLLDGLIGSSDGKKFRNFAQGLTFEMMITHANSQLKKMTDRYILVHGRKEKQPLELSVIDCYQAGEERTTKNLSGGESFIVSLALALGLSNMASRNVRVDSLFLDEGFGTLDEEALDVALTTLASLNQEGKLIGVISHVPAMQERISTQIQVVPQTGGKSVISGPGVSREAS